MGVDSSTQSTKIEVRDADTGELVTSGRADHPPTTPPRSEQDPEAWWSALGEAFNRAGRPAIAALSVAAQQHGLVVLDGEGRVIRPAKLWNDTESAPQAAAMVDERSATWWAATTGSVPVASFTVTKLRWLAEAEPHHFAAVRWVLLPHDWLTSRLTGRLGGRRGEWPVTDRGDASGTGYWSPASGTWSSDALAAALGDRARDAEWSTRLPLVLGPTEAAGPVAPREASEIGLPPGSPVVVGPGTGDNMAAAIGLGVQPGDVVISLGTSGTVYTVSAVPTHDATGATAGFADATGRYLPLVCTLNATLATDAVARLLGVDRRTFDELALSGPPGSGGLVMVPYLAGERTPNRPDATGTVTGLRTDVTRQQLARAAVEGVVCGLLDGLDALAATGVPTGGRLFLVGGGSSSAAYRRVVADLAQRPVTVAPGEEHVALGMCIQAAAVLHGTSIDEVAEAWALEPGRVIEPDPDHPAGMVRAAYAEVRDRW